MLPKVQLVAEAAPRRVLSRKAVDKPLPYQEHQKKKGGLEPPKWKSLRKTYNPLEISGSAGVGSPRRRFAFYSPLRILRPAAEIVKPGTKRLLLRRIF